ncbi:tRNA 2-thiouridine(34) synthase MnmA [Candidatus Parcubacteria bacterium]|nr:tRNA 2-thiouridine(34) synthase MnmA [Candidatus Parcubacteria bacterium]
MKGKKVYVGMSGGVDSSVSAYLLKKQGYDVTGVFIRVWQPDNSECTWKDERRDAMRVCAHLDIPFITLDLREEYKKGVVDYMFHEYSVGNVPNPDVMCNREVKFGAFWKWAKENGGDYIATGHYAQNVNNSLWEGKDKNKDQSYFLWTLELYEMPHILFPVGHLDKPEVRKLATKAKIPVFDKKDSQGVCFLGQIDMKEFLKQHIETHKGNVLDLEGNIVGEHDGAVLYAIGERHGFTIFKNTNNQERLYITSKDIHANTITVGTEVKIDTDIDKGILVKNVVLRDGLDAIKTCRLRYRQEKTKIKSIEKEYSYYRVILENPEMYSSGQSIVFYNENVCVGGGVMM